MDSGDVFKIPTYFLNQSVQKSCPRDSWSSAADLSARGFDSALSHFLCKCIALSCTDETEIPIDHWLILLLKPPPPSSKEKTFLCAKHWTGQHVLFIILWRLSPSLFYFFCFAQPSLANTHLLGSVYFTLEFAGSNFKGTRNHISCSAPGRPVCRNQPRLKVEGAGDYSLVQVTMSARGEEAGEASGSQEQPAPADPPKRGPGRPRKPPQVSLMFLSLFDRTRKLATIVCWSPVPLTVI